MSGETLTDTFTAVTTDSTSQVVTVTINGADDAPNSPPTFPPGSEKHSIPENSTFVFNVNATDPDGDTLTYSIVNTAETDFNKFTIDPNTGALAFISAPNFESPNDVGGKDNDNKYVVDIQASDGVLTDTQTIEVQVTNVTVNAIDDIVRTGSSITVVPEWALLHNDISSAVGKILDITVTGSVSDLSDASLGINPGSVTITNNDADGGSFVYTASDGIETATATVTVETGATPMTGDNNDEILVGTSAAETINGGGGNDILIGGGGADTLIGGNGDDVLVYAPGVSLINGGTNGHVDLRAADNRGDVLSVEGTVDFTSLGDVFQDIETISMLAKDGSNGNSTITLDITNVLDLADSAIARFCQQRRFRHQASNPHRWHVRRCRQSGSGSRNLAAGNGCKRSPRWLHRIFTCDLGLGSQRQRRCLSVYPDRHHRERDWHVRPRGCPREAPDSFDQITSQAYGTTPRRSTALMPLCEDCVVGRVDGIEGRVVLDVFYSGSMLS